MIEDYIVQHWEGVGLVIYVAQSLLRGWWRRRTDKERTESLNLRILSDALASAVSNQLAQSKRIDQLEAERITANDRRIVMQNTIDELRDEVCQYQAAATTVNTQLEQLRVDSQKAIDELTEELVKVKKALAEARQEAQNMKNSITELTSALKAAQDRVKELETREQQLRISLAEAKEQIARLERDNMAKDTALNALQARVKDLEIELRKTQDERAALEQANADLLKRLAEIQAPDRSAPEVVEAHEPNDEASAAARDDKEQS